MITILHTIVAGLSGYTDRVSVNGEVLAVYTCDRSQERAEHFCTIASAVLNAAGVEAVVREAGKEGWTNCEQVGPNYCGPETESQGGNY